MPLQFASGLVLPPPLLSPKNVLGSTVAQPAENSHVPTMFPPHDVSMSAHMPPTCEASPLSMMNTTANLVKCMVVPVALLPETDESSSAVHFVPSSHASFAVEPLGA